MNIHDPRWWADSKWHRGLAELVEAQEDRPPAHNVGTPRHPRTARTVARKYRHNHVRVGVAGEQPRPMARLLAAGYYDAYRRAFEAADA